MKLTCVLIITVLFLTACQLTTAVTYSRGEHKHRALMSTGTNYRLPKTCRSSGRYCRSPYDRRRRYCRRITDACV
uniref:Alpha-conotoxin GeXIVA n=1 Tax=Conus generalis TaxID=101304 RepID=CO1EA_CONGR|nr:RecName: Full=Alpha-conotoxin GeXIVA; AltName: Full=Alpha-O-conotoxin GeXIVA; AltName: Full=Conotoxin Ge14.1; AltName: Full=Conotoxin GeXIVAWT; Flags: Precursor [Conus generalis]AKB95553.1 alpha-O-conotoxin GeXIVA precursor [Conus generalis]